MDEIFQDLKLDIKVDEVIPCDSCNIMNQKKNDIRKITNTIKKNENKYCLEYIAIDLIGPLEKGRENERFAMVIVDKATKFIKVIPMNNKSDTTIKLFQWIDGTTGFGHEVQHIHTDNGKEFVNNNFKQFCKHRGITTTSTAPCQSHPKYPIVVDFKLFPKPHERFWKDSIAWLN